jgi:hypothetical protein
MKTSLSLHQLFLTRILSAIILVALADSGMAKPAAEAASGKNNPILPPLPVFSPTALTGDAGDQRAYLRWNFQLEDPRVLGWKVIQLKPVKAELTPDMLREPAYVARNLKNGDSYTFTVVGVLQDGTTTPESNPTTVTPGPTGETKISTVENQRLSFGEFRDIALRQPGVRIVFPDGQELTYANCRPVDWKTRDGEHLIYPRPFGNNVDIGQFQKSGLPRIIPPEGLKDAALPGGVYRDVQYGFPHPHITDPLTVPYDQTPHDTAMRWRPPTVDGNRVTVEYWVPLTVWGYTAWTYVRVWETWWPIDADRHGTKYHGLARLVEVEMPNALKLGYQVMLNNGFGPAGSRKGVVSYSSGFRVPGHEVVDFSGDHNRAVTFQSPKFPRRGGYHATQDSLQSSPLIFYDWGKGSLTITARSLYYHCANNSASYPEQGADGVWPNLAWDMAMAGQRTPVDTVEYLYTADLAQPLPQRYANARFEAYGNVSLRMGVQDAVTGVVMEQHHIKPDPERAPVAGMIDKIIDQRKNTGTDDIGIFLAFWHIAPYATDPEYRSDPDFALNRDIKAAISKLRAAGFNPGFWFRPEVAKTSIASILSDKIPDAEYDWFFGCRYPDLPKQIAERGIPIVRNNTNWIRRHYDGSWPEKTPYNWVEMSMASRWWDEVVWPALVTSKKLGFDWLLMDGGFGGLSGVDYAPMLSGQTTGAVPCQPYWWRMFRSMKHIGMSNVGECTLGWRGGDVVNIGDGDEYFQWMFNQSTIYDNSRVTSLEQIHKFFQLYNNQQRQGGNPIGNDAIRRYAKEFYTAHKAPDWIEFKNLKPGEPVTKTLKVTDSPVAGAATRVGDTLTETIIPWTWNDVVWHYADGSSVVYPAFDKIDWAKSLPPSK